MCAHVFIHVVWCHIIMTKQNRCIIRYLAIQHIRRYHPETISRQVTDLPTPPVQSLCNDYNYMYVWPYRWLFAKEAQLQSVSNGVTSLLLPISLQGSAWANSESNILQEKIWSHRHGLCDTMMTSSNGNILRVTGPLCRKFTGHRWILLTKASDAERWCFFDLCLNKRLSKHSRRRWSETPSRSYDITVML